MEAAARAQRHGVAPLEVAGAAHDDGARPRRDREDAALDAAHPPGDVDLRKQARLTACAQRYLQENPAASQRPCRFDVVAISGAGDKPEIV